MTTFFPRLDVLPAAQRELWPSLAKVPLEFVLYGGTGIALRFGHRASVDFDFFSHAPLDHHALERALPWLKESESVQEEPNARTVMAPTTAGPVKVSFFGNIRFGRVGEPQIVADGTLRVASVLDLAGTKVKALLQRVEAKDYLDVAALLRNGVPIEQILGAARSLFGESFNPLIAKKTLSWFEGGDLASLPDDVRQTLVNASTSHERVVPLPRVSDRLD